MAATDTDRILGQLLEAVNGLRRDVDQLREEHNEIERSASEGRRNLHDRIEATSERLSRLDNTVVVAGTQIAQIRDVVLGLERDTKMAKATLENEVMPVVRTVNLIEGAGKKYLVRSAIAGAGLATGIGGAIVANWSTIIHWFKALS